MVWGYQCDSELIVFALSLLGTLALVGPGAVLGDDNPDSRRNSEKPPVPVQGGECRDAGQRPGRADAPPDHREPVVGDGTDVFSNEA